MYKNSKRKFSKRKSSIYLLILLLPFLFIFMTFFLNQGIRFYGNNLVKAFEEEDLNKLWNEKKYSQIVTICEEVLNENFLELNYLYFHGISNFYLGISQISLEMKIPLINQSIVSLRKAYILSSGKLKGDITYVLGKAYYYKGRNYSDLTIKYLDIALVEGYLGKDIYEFKGLAYYELGLFPESIKEFEYLPEERHSPEINYIISQAYNQIGNFEKQEEMLLDILGNSGQKNVKINSHVELAKIYFNSKRYIEAIEQVNDILQLRPDDFEAGFILGKSLFITGKKVEANKIFRKLSKINSNDKELISWLKR
ncbi:MAG: hypothetical protein OCD02_20600 [Spirochaetaceae bacterium]